MEKQDFSSIFEIIEYAKKENLCTRWGCTTCGTLPFRYLTQAYLGLPKSSSLDLPPAGSRFLCDDLCKIKNITNHEAIELLLRWVSVNLQTSEMREILQQSTVGEYFELMLYAKARRDQARKEHDMRNDPEFVKANREAKKQARAEAHAERLRQKAIREGKI